MASNRQLNKRNFESHSNSLPFCVFLYLYLSTNILLCCVRFVRIFFFFFGNWMNWLVLHNTYKLIRFFVIWFCDVWGHKIITSHANADHFVCLCLHLTFGFYSNWCLHCFWYILPIFFHKLILIYHHYLPEQMFSFT